MKYIVFVCLSDDDKHLDIWIQNVESGTNSTAHELNLEAAQVIQ